LKKDLDNSRTRSYFMARGENVADVSAISASVILNNELFAIAVAGPGPRIDCQENVIARHLLTCRNRLRKSFD
jgi:DNA-binding IclR family transcriptional regulator